MNTKNVNRKIQVVDQEKWDEIIDSGEQLKASTRDEARTREIQQGIDGMKALRDSGCPYPL